MRSHNDANHTNHSDDAGAAATHPNHSDDAAAAFRSRGFLTDPWSQAVLTGVLTLIPARSYPSWLRRGIIWGPTVIGAVLPAYLGVSPEARRQFTERVSRTGLYSARQADGGPTQEPAQQRRVPGVAVAAIVGGAVGAVLSAGLAVSFWADAQAERGLRRLNVPCPRAVMGAAAGAATWWMATKDNEREPASGNASQ